MAEKDYISVSQLNYFINNIFASEELLHNVPVLGEISGFSEKNGVCYFTLKDEKSQIKAVAFGMSASGRPNNGEKVIVRGAVTYYQPRGEVSIRVYEVTRFGIGEMYVRLQQLKEKLTAEGLFREEHKKSIPLYPKRIGIITSVQGAAIQDIMSTFNRKRSKQNLSIIDVRVQGESCVKDVCTALNYADSYGFDVIILARGGGSFEDLYEFNDEQIVRTIYNMQTPVITGIGHETDYTLCDFVSDFRAITPTASAEKVAVDFEEEREDLLSKIKTLKSSIEKKYQLEKNKIKSMVDMISLSSNATIQKQYENIVNKLKQCSACLRNNYIAKNKEIRYKMSILDNISPLKLLNNGYFRIIHNGKVENDFTNIEVNDEIKIYGVDENITAIVKEKEKNELR